jgi:Tol biopolymer transport system component
MDEVLNIATQTAEALQEAHEHDITHRDIKSENIMVTPKGQVKVMDFGLAKLKGVGGLTKNGTTIGTISYMSPEQAQGEDVDHRTDIWSFGVVLYEMITGKLPFKGGYEQAVIYSILNEEPESVQKYRPNLSFEFLHLLNRTLKKNCEDRYLSAPDMLKDLKRLQRNFEKKSRKLSTPILEIKQPDEVEKGVSFRPRSRKLIGLMTLSFIFFTAIVIIFITKPFIREAKLPLRITPFTTLPGDEYDPCFSPFGNQLTFIWTGEIENNFDIYVKPIGEGQPHRVTTHPGLDISPTWSPDGNSIAFLRYAPNESGIYKVPILGGVEKKLHALRVDNIIEYFPTLDWSPNGKLMAFSDKPSSDSSFCIYALTVQNQNVKKLTSPPLGIIGDVVAKFSPDGKMLAIIRTNAYASSNIYILGLKDSKLQRLTFDNDQIRDLAWTGDGNEVIYSSPRGGIRNLWSIAVDGGDPEPFMISAKNPVCLAISRDGKKLAYEDDNREDDIWRVNISNVKEKPTKIIYSRAQDHTPRYSPDGEKIVFGSARSGFPEIWVCDSSGQNLVQLTNFEGHHCGAPCWSPDGNFIAFDSPLESPGDIFSVDVQIGSLKQLTHDPSHDSNPYWSRDGKWIYFLSNRSGRYQIWKMPAQGGEAIQVTSKGGGSSTVESYDGRWLYYDCITFKSEKPRGIWRISVDGGEEHCVLDIDTGWRQWALTHNGIYYIKRLSNTHYSLNSFSFRTGDVKKIGEFNLNVTTIFTIDVSPDQRHMIIWAVKGNSDIILVENFQ